MKALLCVLAVIGLCFSVVAVPAPKLQRFRQVLTRRLEQTQGMLEQIDAHMEASALAETEAQTDAHSQTIAELAAEADAEAVAALRTGARASTAAQINALNAAKSTFIIADTGSSGTRFIVYKRGAAAGVPAPNGFQIVHNDGCANKALNVGVETDTNMDAVGRGVLNTEADRIVGGLLNKCLATIVAGMAAPPWNTLPAHIIASADDVKYWLATVPIFYEATAGMRLAQQDTSLVSTTDQIWAEVKLADQRWRVLKAAELGAGGSNYVAAGWEANGRAILNTRTIPGALEAWYGFRAALPQQQAAGPLGWGDADANHLIYVEVGGASQQIAFTIPAPTNPNDNNVATKESGVSFAETDATAQGQAEAFAAMTARVAAESSAEAESLADVANGVFVTTNAETETNADTSALSATEGPMHLKLTGLQYAATWAAGTPRLYAKSFLGNGLNRMLVAVVKEAIKDGAKTKCPNGAALDCFDVPCFADNAMFGPMYPSAGPPNIPQCWGPYAGPAGPIGFDTKICQDLYNDLDIRGALRFLGAGGNPVNRRLVGTGNTDKCLAHVRRVWKGVDEHSDAYAYRQQFTEVRAALQLANRGGMRKTHVIVNAKPIDSDIGGGNHDRQRQMPHLSLEAWLLDTRAGLLNRPIDRFAFNRPLAAVYFESLLWDGIKDGSEVVPTFDLDRLCSGCSYMTSTLGFVSGAADFFDGWLALPSGTRRQQQKASDYLRWAYRVDARRNPGNERMDLEDPMFGLCREYVVPAGTTRAAARAQCRGIMQSTGEVCVLKIGSADSVEADYTDGGACVDTGADGMTQATGGCYCTEVKAFENCAAAQADFDMAPRRKVNDARALCQATPRGGGGNCVFTIADGNGGATWHVFNNECVARGGGANPAADSCVCA